MTRSTGLKCDDDEDEDEDDDEEEDDDAEDDADDDGGGDSEEERGCCDREAVRTLVADKRWRANARLASIRWRCSGVNVLLRPVEGRGRFSPALVSGLLKSSSSELSST